MFFELNKEQKRASVEFHGGVRKICTKILTIVQRTDGMSHRDALVRHLRAEYLINKVTNLSMINEVNYNNYFDSVLVYSADHICNKLGIIGYQKQNITSTSTIVCKLPNHEERK